MSSLFIVATPIGNLEDASERMIRTLKSVNLILAEDTRVSKRLLQRFGIKKPIFSFHQHSSKEKIGWVISELRSGKDIALIVDCGTPGISDPGNILVEKVYEKLDDQVKIVPIPGPSALTALASVSGFPMDRFVFLGFPPSKRKRKKFFEQISKAEYSVIFFESPYRIMKTLAELMEAVGGERKVVVGREISKQYETFYRGTVPEVADKIKKDKIRGEFVVIVRRE